MRDANNNNQPNGDKKMSQTVTNQAGTYSVTADYLEPGYWQLRDSTGKVQVVTTEVWQTLAKMVEEN